VSVTPSAPRGLPPRLRWPATVQSLLALGWGEGFQDYLWARFGRSLRMRFIGVGDVVVVSDPDAVRTLFTGDRSVVHAGEANARVLPVVGRNSVLLLDDDRHLRMRRMLLPPFHGEAVASYAALAEEIATAEIDRWPVGQAFPVLPSMQAVTLDVILRAVVGITDQERLRRLRSLLPRVLEVSPLAFLIEGAYPWTARGRVAGARPWVRARREADRLLYEEVTAHRADPDGRTDVLAMLVAARDEAGAPLTDQELHDQLLTLLLAGHETTASSLAWCFERLMRHPAVLHRLTAELSSGDGDAYLEAVINETFRTRPVIEVLWRRLTAPFEVAGHVLPAGTIVVPSITGIQRSDAYDAPEDFRPERFLEVSPPPYSLIPFGGGPRRCVGASFAVMEMKTILRAVLGRFELHAPGGRAERQDRLRRFTTVPSRGGRIVVRRRAEAPTAAAAPVSAGLAR
jgi:cytochrome P450